MAYSDQVHVLKTWEWLPQYKLRNTLYPAYLSLPLHLARALGVDSNCVVRCAPVVMNTLLIVLGDFYTYKLCLRLLNREVAQIVLTWSLFSKTVNQILLKTMTNGAEAVLCIMALYYYSKLQYNKSLLFTRELVIMTFGITLSFLIRSSSLIGWIPLALAAILFSRRPIQSL